MTFYKCVDQEKKSSCSVLVSQIFHPWCVSNSCGTFVSTFLLFFALFSWMFWMGTDPRSVPFNILAGRCSKACGSFPCSLIHSVRLVSDHPSGCICRVSGRRLNCDARQVLLLMVTFRRRRRGGGASVLGGMEGWGAAWFLCSHLWLPLAELKQPGWFHTTFPRVRFNTPLTLGKKGGDQKTEEELRGDWILSDVCVVTLLQSQR